MELIVSLLLSTLRTSTPLIFAAFGGMMSERSGVINIALEGKMLVGAFCGAVIGYHTGSAWWGFLAGGLGGAIISSLYAFLTIRLGANQIVSGMAINLLAAGMTPFLTNVFYGNSNSTPSLSIDQRFTYEPIAVAFLLAVFIYILFARTRLGLRLSFAGENPFSLITAGVSVLKIRWTGVLLSGFFAGLGGASLSLFLSSAFSREMTAGRGFMALAALILGKWKPIPTLLACLFFGAVDSAQVRLQGVVLWGDEPVPVQFIQILPYLLTLVVISGFIGKSRPPRFLGQALINKDI